MRRDRMQQQRFELKYLIPEETALLVRDFVRSYLQMDEYSVGRPNYSYPVHSLYLDSQQLKLYWDTINGNKNPFKPRLPYYSTSPHTPVFFRDQTPDEQLHPQAARGRAAGFGRN